MNLLWAERVSSLLQPKVHQGSNKFLMDSSKTLWSSRKEVSALQPGRICLAQYHTDLDPPALKPQTRLPVWFRFGRGGGLWQPAFIVLKHHCHSVIHSSRLTSSINPCEADEESAPSVPQIWHMRPFHSAPQVYQTQVILVVHTDRGMCS